MYSFCSNVLNIQSRDSFDGPRIQFVDNLCSVIRLSCLESKNDYYSIIKEKCNSSIKNAIFNLIWYILIVKKLYFI